MTRWRHELGDLAPRLREDTKKKYLSPNPFKQLLLARFFSALKRLVREQRPKTLLEVGCGEGLVSCLLRRRFPALQIVAGDRDACALQVARALLGSTPLVLLDGTSLPFRDRSFDVALGIEVLEHLPEPAAMVRELVRVSRKAVIVSVPEMPFYQLTNLAAIRQLRRLGEHPDHRHQFTKKTLFKLLAANAPLGCTVTISRSLPWLLSVVARTHLEPD